MYVCVVQRLIPPPVPRSVLVSPPTPRYSVNHHTSIRISCIHNMNRMNRDMIRYDMYVEQRRVFVDHE